MRCGWIFPEPEEHERQLIQTQFNQGTGNQPELDDIEALRAFL